MKIIQKFITKDDSYQNNVKKVDSRYTTFQKRGPLGLMLHSVGTAQPDASVFAKGWNRPGREASVHAVLQADGTVYQTMPWNFRAWHCGGSANNTHVGVEMCEPGSIKYTNGDRFTILNYNDAKSYAIGCYKTAVDLFAKLCEAYHLDPMTAIISHSEGYKKGVASNHSDPEHLWRGLDLSYTMDTFRKAVAAKMKETEEDMTSEQVRSIVQEELKKINIEIPEPVITRDMVLKVLDDQWIETYRDLPPWAKPEVMEMIQIGAIKGTEPVDDPEDTVIRASLNSYIRPAIVAYRAMKVVMKDSSIEQMREQLNIVLSAFNKH